jgi:hypothetical protein
MKKHLIMNLFAFFGMFVFTVTIADCEELLSEASHHHSVKSLEDRVEELEKTLEKKEVQEEHDKWNNRITVSGLLETEAGYTNQDFNDPLEEDTDSSDITLATVEIGVGAKISEHVAGHILMLWEQGATEPFDIDEGIIFF